MLLSRRYSPKEAKWPGWKFYASIDMSPTNNIWQDNVMEGAVEVCHGKKCHLIKAGDSIYYDSIVPHHVHGYQGQAAKILAVIYTPI